MNSFFEFFKTLTNPESILSYGGITLLLIVVFSETGLLVGFFLPGDSLIFLSGLFCSIHPEMLHSISLPVLWLSLIAAAVAGNMVGYWFGYKTGPGLFARKDNFIFKKKRLFATRDFYEKHGGKTLILGRFLPVIRTFAPILAGIIRIDFKRFMWYNLIGAAAWIISFSACGYYLGKIYPGIEKYLGYIVIGLIIVTAIPVVVAYNRAKKNGQKNE